MTEKPILILLLSALTFTTASATLDSRSSIQAIKPSLRLDQSATEHVQIAEKNNDKCNPRDPLSCKGRDGDGGDSGDGTNQQGGQNN